MKVSNLTLYFEDSCYPMGGINACFNKESDVERILSNKRPLNVNDGQSVFVSVQAPFSFNDLSIAIFESVGNVLVLDKNGTTFYALRPSDAVDVCLSVVGALGDQIIYRTPSANDAVERFNSNRTVKIENEKATRIWENVIKAMHESQLMDVGLLDDANARKKVQLAALLFPPAYPSLDEFYFTAVSILQNEISKKSTDRAADLNVDLTTESSNVTKSAVALMYDKMDESVLIPTLYKEDVLLVQGHPLKRRTVFKSVETNSKAPPSKEFSNYQLVLTEASVTATSFLIDETRFSRVLSSLCQLERFGHFSNEREIALEHQKIMSATRYEDNVYRLRKCRNRERDDRPLPWTDLCHRAKRKNAPSGTEFLVSDPDFISHGDRDYKEPIDFNHRTALSGLTEEIPVAVVSPFDVLRWKHNETCLYQGERFSAQFCEFDRELSNSESLFLAVVYAFFSGALSDDSFNSMELEYGHTRPSLDSYEWYLTYDGVLYFKRMKRRNFRSAADKRNVRENNANLATESSYSTSFRQTAIQKPCFLDDIEMDVETSEDEGTTIDNGKKWTGKYTNENKTRDRFKRNGDFLTNRKSPRISEREDDASRDTGAPREDRFHRRFYDPCVLRKYDGRGLFPVFASEEELTSKREQNQILFDSDRFLSNEGDGFFKLHDCFRRDTTKPRADHAEIRIRSLSTDRCQMTDMIDFASFFVQYTDLCSELISDDDDEEYGLGECDDDNEYRDEGDGFLSSKRKRRNGRKKRSYEPIVKKTHVRGVDYDFIQNEVTKMLIPEEARLKKGLRYHEANPLWMQCGLYVCSKEFKIRTICLTYENVPKSIEDVHFLLNYHRIRCDPIFSLCLGYFSPRNNVFKYDTFDCVVELNRGIDIPNKYHVYKVDFEYEEEEEEENQNPAFAEIKSDDKRNVIITKSLITEERFRNILDASVLFVINSGF